MLHDRGTLASEKATTNSGSSPTIKPKSVPNAVIGNYTDKFSHAHAKEEETLKNAHNECHS